MTSVFSSRSKPLPVEAQRYAQAFYELAAEQKALPTAEADLARVKKYYAESQELRRFLLSPLLRRSLTAQGLAAVLDKSEAGKLTRGFFQVVAMNGRARDIPTIIEAFLAILAEKRGELRAVVTSVRPLSEAQAAELKDAILTAFGGHGAREVKLETHIDAGLLGGLRVQVGSYLFDGTLKGELQKLGSSLKNAA